MPYPPSFLPMPPKTKLQPALKHASIWARVCVLLSLTLPLTFLWGCKSMPFSQETQIKVSRSPQWRDGKFRNKLPRGKISIFKILWKSIFNGAETKPKQKIPVLHRSQEEFLTPPTSGLRITWLGHSSILIEIDGKRVLTDPVWSERVSPVSWAGPKRFFEPPLKLEDLPPLDAVVISHDHFDHLDEATLSMLKERVPLFAVPLGVDSYLEKLGIPRERIQTLDWWEDVQIGDVTLTATPARHFSGRSLFKQDPTLWAGWAIAGPKHRVFFSGDTAMFPGFKDIGQRLGPFDITLIETGAYDALWANSHLGPEQAAQAHRMLAGRWMMPIHWGTFDLANHSWTEPVERLLVESQKDALQVVVPQPGQSIDIDSMPKPTRWWPDIPWKNAQESPARSTGFSEPLPR